MGARSLATVTFRRLPLVGHGRSGGGSAANKINLDTGRPSHRSGARGKLTASHEYLCGEATHRIPNWRSSVISTLPFPVLRFSAGSEPRSRLPVGAPKAGAVWTAAPSPLQEKPH